MEAKSKHESLLEGGSCHKILELEADLSWQAKKTENLASCPQLSQELSQGGRF